MLHLNIVLRKYTLIIIYFLFQLLPNKHTVHLIKIKATNFNFERNLYTLSKYCLKKNILVIIHSKQTVHLVSVWVVDVDGDDLPVGLTLVHHGQNPQHLHLDHLTPLAHPGPDLAHVHWIVVPHEASVPVLVVRVLPRLCLGKNCQGLFFVKNYC